MAELSPEDQLAFHEFSVRYCAALAKQHPLSEQNLAAIREAIRSEYEREQEAGRGPSLDPSVPQPDREPEEPDEGR